MKTILEIAEDYKSALKGEIEGLKKALDVMYPTSYFKSNKDIIVEKMQRKCYAVNEINESINQATDSAIVPLTDRKRESDEIGGLIECDQCNSVHPPDWKLCKSMEKQKPDAILETVDLIASGYEWECPNCENLNNEIEITDLVKCGQCDWNYGTIGANHANG